jgi:hypothetical protein
VIVVSLLLILVAVTLLVLGLAGGSSTLLISSIVASLLAAVSLVIGARQAATRRRGAAPAGVPPTPDEDPFFADAPGLDEFAGDPPPGRDFSGSDPIVDAPAAGPSRRTEPDYDHASSVIGAARNADGSDESWRRDPDAAAPPPAASSTGVPSGPAADHAASDDPSSGADDHGFASAADDGESDDRVSDDRVSDRVSDDRVSDDGVFAPVDDSRSTAAAPAEEFGEPDEDDPADEPLPQAVRPGDAVRVARMDAEVLVVDGRPRYHVADCPHLVGRLTEPLPANEAVELGFSPCGLCRPVDRLVAEAAHH